MRKSRLDSERQKHLCLALLIDAQQQRVLGRIQIRSDDIFEPGSELRIAAAVQGRMLSNFVFAEFLGVVEEDRVEGRHTLRT